MPDFQQDEERAQNINREWEAALVSSRKGKDFVSLPAWCTNALMPQQLYIMYRSLNLSAERYTTAPGHCFMRKCLRLIFAVSKSFWLADAYGTEIQDTFPYIMLIRLVGLCPFEGPYAFGKKMTGTSA